jgi:hypothetical protein
MKTKEDIDYYAAPYGHIAKIPAGTKVIPATNLPEPGQYWARAWPGMNDEELGWLRGYGFLLGKEDVTK